MILGNVISIHALLAESDSSKIISSSVIAYFYPRSPCGERLASAGRLQIVYNFYPRSPCGERRFFSLWCILCLYISIHALLAESDFRGWTLNINGPIFLSTLSLRRATFASAGRLQIVYNFYPRSPCGERRRPALAN